MNCSTPKTDCHWSIGRHEYKADLITTTPWR